MENKSGKFRYRGWVIPLFLGIASAVLVFGIVMAARDAEKSSESQTAFKAEIKPLVDEAMEILLKEEPSPNKRVAMSEQFLKLGSYYIDLDDRENGLKAFQKAQEFGKPHTTFSISPEEMLEQALAAREKTKEYLKENPEAKFPSESEIKKMVFLADIERIGTIKDIDEKLDFQRMIIQKLIEDEMADEAEKVLDQMPENAKNYAKTKFPLACRLRNLYEKNGEKQKAAAIEKQCRELFSKIEKPDKKDSIHDLICLGNTDEAMKLLDSTITEPLEKGLYLKPMVLELARQRKYERATEMAGKVESFSETTRMIAFRGLLEKIIGQQLENGDFDEIENILPILSSEDERLRNFDPTRLFCLIAKKKESLGDHEGAIKAMDRAIDAARKNGDEMAWMKSGTAIILADALCALMENTKAVTLLAEIQEQLFKEYDAMAASAEDRESLQSGPHRIVWVFDVLATAQFRAGDPKGGMATLEKMLSLLKENAPDAKLEELHSGISEANLAYISYTAGALAREGYITQAIELLKEVPDDLGKAAALIEIVKQMNNKRHGIPPTHRVYDQMINAPFANY